MLGMTPLTNIGARLRGLCAQHHATWIFAATLDRLGRDDLPIVQFVDQLADASTWAPSRRNQIFGSTRPSNGPYPYIVALQIPAYDAFLQATTPLSDRFTPSSPAQLIHDLVGHLLLGQPTTPSGELVACAGVAGFSWEAGADYFVNALLMFSLGLPLYEDVVPAQCCVDQTLAAACDAACNRGWHLRRALKFEGGVTPMAFSIVAQWQRLFAEASTGGPL